MISVSYSWFFVLFEETLFYRDSCVEASFSQQYKFHILKVYI